ncbi:MAG TPA: chemotaxis protein CheD [Fibrobacteria bacterium]|nr:chemotaxis protein CheD [Fibrobacteria bacterium]
MLGIGDFGATSDPDEVIKTIGLGSCVAVIVSNPDARIAGMIHVALPDSVSSPERREAKPGYFADTGLPALFGSLKKVGWSVARGRSVVKLAGGATILDPNGTFNIGKRNVLAIKKILWSMGMGPIAEDIGGNISRTVSVNAGTGAVLITSPGRPALNL